MKFSALVSLFLILVCGCGESRVQQKKAAQAVMELGKVENGVYQNSYFGLSIPVPQGWYVAPNETMDQLMKQGAKTVSGNDAAMQSAIESAPTVNLCSIFEHPPGAPVDFNPSMLGV